MTLTILKDGASYLKNEDDELLKAPDLTADPAGKYVVEEDGAPLYDPATDEVYLVEKEV
jgi:hypothetical protein